MTIAILYCIIAILVIALVGLLLRFEPRVDTAEDSGRQEDPGGLWDSRGLGLAERILDPADYLWLRNQLGFPTLAESLRQHRKHLAVRWLNALRSSFSEVVRSTDPSPYSHTRDETPGSWKLLWMTLRFQLLLLYAILVVRCFGPYHRLIPPLGWVEFPWEVLSQRGMNRNASARRSA